jgi:hypothetical protein
MENKNRSSLVLGALLLAVGVLFLAWQIVGANTVGFTWPLIIVGIGVVFYVGMIVGGKSMGPLAIPGTIIAGIGTILLLQNAFNLWESWSYAWGLIISFIGLGMFIAGVWSDNPGLRRSGIETGRIGLILFIVFGAIFEGIFSLVGIRQANTGVLFPSLLTLIGLWMLVSRSVRLLQRGEGNQGRDLNLFWPIVFVGAGVLWCMVKLGMIPSDQVNGLLNLWPLLLVAAGVDLILGRRFPVINLITGILVVATMFSFVYFGKQLGLPTSFNWVVNTGTFSGISPFNERITGSGVEGNETRSLADFTEIDLTAIGDADIAIGANNQIVITADDNLLPYITTEVHSGRLEVGFKKGYSLSSIPSIHYTITMRQLAEVKVSGSANVTIPPLTSDELKLNVSGLGEFTVTDLQTRNLDVTLSGKGTLNASGKVESLNVSISGAGELNCADLQIKDAQLRISGLGNATLWTTDNLNATISGSGNISYYGNPHVSETKSGIGSLKNLGDK